MGHKLSHHNQDFDTQLADEPERVGRGSDTKSHSPAASKIDRPGPETEWTQSCKEECAFPFGIGSVVRQSPDSFIVEKQLIGTDTAGVCVD